MIHLPFSTRLRLLRNKRYEDWWHIVFGGPLGVLVAASVAEVRWITPNLVTIVGFVLRLAGAGLVVVRAPWADVAALVLLELSLVLDITDGSLARYRKQPSALGAFLDKITDGASLAALGFALGVRAWLDGHGLVHVLAGAFLGTSYLLRCYMYWVVAYLERERAAPASVVATDVRPFGELSFGERLRYYLAQTWRIVMFGEGDVYFWVGLALLLQRPSDIVLPLAGAMAVWLLLLAVRRVGTVIRLDRAAAAARAQAREATP
ncbi:MAG TPA: CDP-alcohol phosphatidyltransferase family protein [Kofleriaceae bacterium]|nr:CDP-alcohol phosphatidyltransferase family protein [Kofleriaceae bacterium]